MRERPKETKPAAWLYGRHAVEAALANPARRCQRLVALRETATEAETLLRAARARPPRAGVEVVERRALEQLLPQGAVHQGLALTADPLDAGDLDTIIAAEPTPGVAQVVVALDQVTDPHNVGAVLRSAAAFGAVAVIVPEHGAPSVTGALAKAASGALEQVPLLRVANLARALEKLKAAGFWTLGLDEHAEQTIAEIDSPERVVVVLGAEGPGLRRLTRERCDFLARLPTRSTMASLNVSNAAAVTLYAVTQRPAR
jgi:23S rRNA (guanosine2251-2'-O)-methyltransferase